QDISLMGFENPGVSEFQRPSLTTIASPLRDMADKAVEIVLRGRCGPLEKVRMNAQLIERNSVRTL
ncbi:LacI family transcriptional regulator, partial [Citrobacter sp. AAK_AS5]